MVAGETIYQSGDIFGRLLIFLLVITFVTLAFTNFGSFDAEGLVGQIGDLTDLTFTGGDYNEIEHANIFFERPDGFPVTAVEINCLIAQDIAFDFGENGVTGHGVDLQAGGVGKVDETLITTGTFFINTSYSDLNDTQKKQLARACRMDVEEEPEIGSEKDYVYTMNFLTGFSECEREVSEKCVTYMLTHMKLIDPVTGDYSGNFCDKEFTPYGGGTAIKFGNDVCGEESHYKSCEELCPGEDRIKTFKTAGEEEIKTIIGGGCDDTWGEGIGDIGEGIVDGIMDTVGDPIVDVVGGFIEDQATQTWEDNILTDIGEPIIDAGGAAWDAGGAVWDATGLVILDLDTDFSDSPYITRDQLSNKPIEKESGSATDYIYVLTWDIPSKVYRIRTYKVPKVADYGKEEPTKVARDLKTVLTLGTKSDQKIKPYQRSSDAGWKVPELRILYQLEFNSSKNISFGEFMKQVIPESWTAYTVPCNSNEHCLSPIKKITRTRWFQVGNHKAVTGDIDWAGENCNECEKNDICDEVGKRDDGITEKFGEQYNLDNIFVYTTLNQYSDANDERASLLAGHTYKIIIHNWVYNHRLQVGPSRDTGFWSKLAPQGLFGNYDRERTLEGLQDISITIIDITDQDDESLNDFLNQNKQLCEVAKDGVYAIELENLEEVEYCTINQTKCPMDDIILGNCPEVQ
jgi:hypothetical protein